MTYSNKFFHGLGKRPPFFEEWHFKHVCDDCALILIPGVSLNSRGDAATAFLQVVTDRRSYNIPFELSEFKASDDRLDICIGNSRFTAEGVTLNIRKNEMEIYGELRYSDFSRIEKHGIMGPLSYFSFFDCYQEIISMQHSLTGNITINGAVYNFDGGKGYIEQQHGRTFPESFIRYQSCDFLSAPTASCVLVAADLPLKLIPVKGVAAVCSVDGHEYKLATYNGAVIEDITESGGETQIIVRRNEYVLRVRVEDNCSVPINAPYVGGMDRIIFECPRAMSHVRLECGDTVILDDEGKNAGFVKSGTCAFIDALRDRNRTLIPDAVANKLTEGEF